MAAQSRGPLPPVLLLAALLLQWVVHTFAPVARVIPDRWASLGAVPILVGVVVMVMAARHFMAMSTEIKPFGTPSTLVRGGPFRFSRNPMYLAMVLILIGAAVAWGTVTPMLLPPTLVWVFSSRFIRMEEVKMSGIFGADYEEYTEEVRRWL